MAGQADGSIIIDTELDPKGFEAGSKELLSAIQSLTQEIKTFGESLKELLGKPLSPKIDINAAEEKVETLETQVKELENELENLKGSASQVQVGATGAKQPKTNTSQASSEAAALEKQLAQIEKSITSLTSKLEQAKAKLKDYYTEQAAIQESTDEMLKDSNTSEQVKNVLAIEQIELEALNEKYATQLSTVKQIEESLEQQRQKQAEIAAQLAAQSQAPTAEMPTAPIDSSGAQRVADETERAGTAAERFKSIFAKAGGIIKNTAKAVGGALVSGLKSAASHLAKMVTHGRSMQSQFGGLISSAKKFALSLLGARGIYALLRKAVSAYMAQNQQLSNTLSSCWSGIGNLLGPIITRLINLVATAIAYVTSFLKLFGIFSSSATSAISSAGGAASSAIKDLKRQLASFDELNILTDNNSDSGGGGGGGAGDISASLPDVTLPDWAKLMVEQLKNGDWAAAAITLTDQLNSMIASVDWAGIGDKIGYYLNGVLTFLATAILNFDWFALGADLATGINHIIENVDWHNLGVVLGAKFIILIEGLGGFFATLDWAGLGKALSDAFMGLWDAIDWAQAAKTLSDGIKGVLTTVTEFLKNTDWEKIGEDIGTFFSEIDWDGIADAAFAAFNAAIEAIKGLLRGLPDEIVSVGAAFVSWKISSKLMSDLGTIMNLPKSFSVGVTLAITGITLEAGGIIDAIQNELDSFNFAEIIGGGGLTAAGGALIGQAFGSAILGGAIGGIVAGLPAFGVGLYDAITEGLDWLNGALIGAGATAAGAGIGAIIGMCGGPIGAGIGALIGLAVGLVTDGIMLIIDNWDAISKFFSEFFTVTIPNIWNSFVTWITKTVPAWFKSLPDKISKWFSDLWQPIKDFDWKNLGYNIGQWFGNAVKDAIHFVTVTVPNWLSGVWNSITSALSTFFTVTLPKFFTEWIPQAWESIKTFFAELPQKIWEAIQSGWNWLVDIGKSIIDGIWEGLQTVWKAITDFVSGFVQGFKDALGIHSPSTVFKEIGDNIIAGLLEGIKAAWSAITGFFSSALSALSNLISGAWNGIKSAASTAWNGIKNTISGAWDGIKSVASKGWETVKSGVSTAWNSVKSTTTNVWNGIKSGLSSAWSSVKSTASSTWTNLKTTISNGWNNVKSNTSSVWSGVKSSLSTTWNNVKSTASTTWTNLKTTISNGWNNIKTATSNTWNSIKSSLTTTWNSVKSTASTTWTNLKTTITNGWNNIKTGTSTAWNSVKSSLSTTWNSIKSTASTTWSNLKSTISTKWNEMKSNASSSWSSIKSSLSSTWNSIKSTASSTFSSIKSTIQNQGWSGVGTNICNGIGNGINSGWSWLKSKVSSVASSLLSAAKSALGIHSPSKLFHDVIGLNIGYGIGEGVEDSTPEILNSVTGVADAIAEEMNAGDYSIRDIVPTAEVDGALTNFTDKISDSFTSMLDRIQSIAENVTFKAPSIAAGVVPYKTLAAAASGSSGDVGSAIEASNDELASVVTQVVMNATNSIVTAIQNYSGTTVNFDRNSVAEGVIREINRRTRMAGQSPLVSG